MEYRQLGSSDLRVSVVGLGTMTWGEQNTEAEAHAQLDLAVDAGVNFIDTAEMYPIPPRAETCGRTETYIGNWLKSRGRRERLVLATKIAGPAAWLPHLREGRTRFNREHLHEAVDASLRRLQTDYLDLYQLHWPERQTNYFGRLGYTPAAEDEITPMEQTLRALAELVEAGKLRHVGVSNETPWGLMRFLQIAREAGLPRVVGIQNPYNLLNRSFEIGLAEIAHRERVGLVAYSPLGFGVLSGKYLGGARPEGARLTRFPDYARYCKPNALKATAAYVKLAGEHGLDPAQMALAFVNSRPFLASTLIGATSTEQLRTNLASAELKLSPEILEGIEAIHERYPNPSP